MSQPAALSLSQTHSNNVCFGGSSANAQVNASGGSGPYNYTLNPGAVTNSNGLFTALPAGAYSVTVSDNKGCSSSINFSITEPAALSMSAMTSTSVLCYGYSTGTATAGNVSGGTAPYSYQWNTLPVQFTSSAIILAAGNYTVIVTDANGCTVTGSVDVNGPASALTVNISNVVNINCNGGGNGSAEAIASGGNGPYSYLWSNGQTNAVASNLISGVYIVTVTDANGCHAQANVTIQQSTSLVLSATPFNISCFGNADGALIASVTGGNPPYNYSIPSISQSNLSGLFFGLSAGSYKIYVVDNGGCMDSTNISLTEPSQLILNKIGRAHV